MSEEEKYDELKLYEKLTKDKKRRTNILINLNVSLQQAQRNVANIKDIRELQEYKVAVVSLENELEELQQENQYLKANLELYENGVYYSNENDKLEQQLDLYKSVIDEIMKYIDKQTIYYGLSMNIELGTHFDNILEIIDKANIKEKCDNGIR